jgi:NAD(P) transhydrogenase subunit alpha
VAYTIAVTRETRPDEPRVAATPETVKKFIAQGATVRVESGAGVRASATDQAYLEAGAEVVADAAAALSAADIVLTVRGLDAASLKAIKPGAVVVGLFDPYRDREALAALAGSGATGVEMSFVPRITRAQVMDVLSSQANLAGYRAVIEAAEAYGKAFPMMMTAAGTVAAAKVFVMGAGVAGLQAIATARRLGAVVTATDVRPAAKEQVESLGAKFVAVEDEEFKAAETSGGYAKEMSDAYKQKQAELTATHIQKQDVVITTALIPGRPAPRLVSAAHVASMKPGSVIVDLAIENGGNVEGARLGEVVETPGGVKIVGYSNLPGRVAADASALYAKNLFALTGLLVKDGALSTDFEDEILKAALIVQGGKVVHPNLQS